MSFKEKKLEENIQKNCFIVRSNQIQIYCDLFFQHSGLEIMASLHSLEDLFEKHDFTIEYNSALKVLAFYLLNTPMTEAEQNTHKKSLELVEEEFKKGFFLNLENYEIQIWQLCEILLMNGSTDVLEFLITHTSSAKLPPLEEMRKLFSTIPDGPDENEYDSYSMLKYFLEFMSLDSFNIPDDVKKNKFLVDMQTFKVETENLLMKFTNEILKEKLKYTEVDARIQLFSPTKVEHYEKFILKWCEAICRKNKNILEFMIYEKENEIPFSVDLLHKFPKELDIPGYDDCTIAIYEVYDFLNVIQANYLPKELRKNGFTIRDFQNEAVPFFLTIAKNYLKKHENQDGSEDQQNLRWEVFKMLKKYKTITI